mgnify:CR=1 FL=1
MGWAPASVRSMMASRRRPSAMPARGSTHMPEPSGLDGEGFRSFGRPVPEGRFLLESALFPENRQYHTFQISVISLGRIIHDGSS